jgi:hypothetical protein
VVLNTDDGHYRILAFNQHCSMGETMVLNIDDECFKSFGVFFFVGPHVIFSSIVCMHVDQGVMECVTTGNAFVCEKI